MVQYILKNFHKEVVSKALFAVPEMTFETISI